MRDTGFFRNKHNILLHTAPATNDNSVFQGQIVPYVSAYISASGTAITQPGRLSGRYAQVPSYSAGIVPSGSITPTGYSNHFYIALVGTSDAHLMAYPGETVSSRFSFGEWIPESE